MAQYAASVLFIMGLIAGKYLSDPLGILAIYIPADILAAYYLGGRNDE